MQYAVFFLTKRSGTWPRVAQIQKAHRQVGYGWTSWIGKVLSRKSALVPRNPLEKHFNGSLKLFSDGSQH